MIVASEPINMDTVEGIKYILKSKDIPSIWKLSKQLIEEHSVGTKGEHLPN